MKFVLLVGAFWATNERRDVIRASQFDQSFDVLVVSADNVLPMKIQPPPPRTRGRDLELGKYTLHSIRLDYARKSQSQDEGINEQCMHGKHWKSTCVVYPNSQREPEYWKNCFAWMITSLIFLRCSKIQQTVACKWHLKPTDGATQENAITNRPLVVLKRYSRLLDEFKPSFIIYTFYTVSQ